MNMGHIGHDSMYLNVDFLVFNDNSDWTVFYRDIEEELPTKIPEPCGRAISIYSFVDDKHVGNFVMRRSQTVIIMFIQNAPIIWFSKKQNTVGADTYGSKLVAHRIFQVFDCFIGV